MTIWARKIIVHSHHGKTLTIILEGQTENIWMQELFNIRKILLMQFTSLWHNKKIYLVLVLCSWHRSPNIPGISWEIGVSFVIHNKPLSTILSGRELVTRKTRHRIRGLQFSVRPHNLWEGEGCGAGDCTITNG